MERWKLQDDAYKRWWELKRRNDLTKGLIRGIICIVMLRQGRDTMDKNETLEKLAELAARIKELPKVYISKKTIGGKIYY